MNLSIFKINQLGDSVVFAPVLKEFVQRLGRDQVTLYCTSIAAEVFGASVPDRTFVLQKARFMRIHRYPLDALKLLSFALKNRSDASLLDLDQGTVAHTIARLFGGNLRLSGECHHLSSRVQSATNQIPYQAGETVSQWSWRVASALCREVTGDLFPIVIPRPDLSHLVDRRLVQENSPEIVIHPGGSRDYQRWPVERFLELAIRLSKDFSVLWIQPQEVSCDLSRFAGKTLLSPSLKETTTFIQSARLFIGNNSGPLNIAYALGTPTVSLWGPTSDLWRPTWTPERHLILRREGFSCLPCDRNFKPANICRNIENIHGCLLAWSVEEIYQKSIEWINR